MKQGQYLKEEKLLKQGVNILMEKLGPIETSRFFIVSTSEKDRIFEEA